MTLNNIIYEQKISHLVCTNVEDTSPNLILGLHVHVSYGASCNWPTTKNKYARVNMYWRASEIITCIEK